MKKLISISFFIMSFSLAIHTDASATGKVFIPRPLLPPPGVVVAGGHWKWNRRMNQWVWVNTIRMRPFLPRRAVRVRLF